MNLPKISFFDDPKIDFWIRSPTPTNDPLISGPLLRTSKKGTLKEGTFYLITDRLVYKQKYIALGNITIEKIKPNTFRLTRNRKTIELQASNEHSFNLWFDYLKLHCI